MQVNELCLPKEKYSRSRTFYKVFRERFLTTRGKPVDAKHFGKNTSVYYNGHGDIVVQLWTTWVVTLCKSGGMVLRTDGYKTHTTKKRISAMLPSGVGLFSQNGVWYVQTWKPGKGPYTDKRTSYVFTEGMVVTESGKVHGAPLATKENECAQMRLKKRLRKFVDGYMDALFAGKVQAPSGCDCWICLLKGKDGKPALDSDPKSHILGHVEEGYYVPSMLHNAIVEAGGLERMSSPVRICLSNLWAENKKADGYWAPYGRRQLAKLLLAYIYRRTGFSAGHLPGHLNAPVN